MVGFVGLAKSLYVNKLLNSIQGKPQGNNQTAKPRSLRTGSKKPNQNSKAEKPKTEVLTKPTTTGF